MDLRTRKKIKEHKFKPVRLGDIAEVWQGDEVNRNQVAKGGSTPAVKCGDINTVLPQVFTQCVNFVNVADFKKPRWAEKNTILVSGFSSCGEARLYKGEQPIIVGSHINTIKTTENPDYVFYCLRSDYCKDQIKPLIRRGMFDHLYAKDLANVKIPLPPREYQDKAVEFLNKHRELTEQYQQRVSRLLELYKKIFTSCRDKIFGFV